LLQKDIHRRILAYGLRLFTKENGTVSGAVLFIYVAITSLALQQASLVQLPEQRRREPASQVCQPEQQLPVLLQVRQRPALVQRLLQTWSQHRS
jgi:hypothetical protein